MKMATLYDYLAGIDVGGSPLAWSNLPLTKSQIDAAGGRPYVRVEELTESAVSKLYNDVDIIQAYVDVLTYQAPANGLVPDRAMAMKLHFDLYDAPKNVDSWIYGQPLIDMHRELAFPPRYDDDSGGLAGMIRFRLLFPRG